MTRPRAARVAGAALLSLGTLLLSGAAGAPPAPCARAAAGSGAVASLELERPVGARDTALSILVCVRALDAGVKVGGFHGEMRYDTLDARLIGVEHLAGAAQVENVERRGSVRFAGAAPDGTAPGGAVLRVRLRALRRGRVPWVDLVMLELNSVAGAPLISRTRIEGLRGAPAHPIAGDDEEERERREQGGAADDRAVERAAQGATAARAPVLASMSPTAGAIGRSGAPVVVTLRGRGFAADGNTVLFGTLAITDVRSRERGRELRFTLPVGVPSGGGAPPMPLAAGRYPVRVRTAAGTSGALTFTLTQ